MPEEKYGSTLRTSCKNRWQARLLRWSVLGIGWITYILYRSFVVGEIKYDQHTGKMMVRPRNMWTKRIALILKIWVMSKDYFGITYILLATYPLIFSRITVDRAYSIRLFEYLADCVVFQIAIWNICRLYYWLRSLSWNRSFVLSVNEVFRIVSLVKVTLGPLPLEGPVLLIIYVLQFDLTVVQIVFYLHSRVYLLALNSLLLIMFYNAYAAYQLLLLSCIATFNSFLETYHQDANPTREQRQKLLDILRLYSKISNGHQDIMVLWLPVASMLYSNIVALVNHWASIIYCIVFIDQMNVVEKWHVFLQKHLGGSLAPFLRILFIGLCNDRLAQLERFLSLQLLIIDLRHPGYPGVRIGEGLAREQTCFDLQSRAQPIRNQIMSLHQVCGCPFVLEFFFCTLLNALNTVQYALANQINVYED